MTGDDHRALLGDGIPAPGGTWADLGCGTGTFTAALAEALGPGAVIWAVDIDAGSLAGLERSLRERFPRVTVRTLGADFNQPLELPPLDGILMANSLHFQRDPCATLERAARLLAPGGRLLAVEYDVSRPSPWVPSPVPWTRLPALAACAGLGAPRLIGVRPSRYHGRVYSAVCLRPAQGPLSPRGT